MVWAKNKSKKGKLVLILILALAFVLRFYKLSSVPVSLFGDELDVGYHGYSILKTAKDYNGNFMPLHFQSLAEYRTPLYLYSVVPTILIWGISPLGVRVPAAFFGVLSVLAIYLLVREIIVFYGKKSKFFKGYFLPLMSALVLAVSPWHIQYSRAAFEVTMLLAFLLFGLYFLFKSFNDGKLLWISVMLLVLTPLIYSTAKLFTPLLFMFLVIVFRKEILSIKKSI